MCFAETFTNLYKTTVLIWTMMTLWSWADNSIVKTVAMFSSIDVMGMRGTIRLFEICFVWQWPYCKCEIEARQKISMNEKMVALGCVIICVVFLVYEYTAFQMAKYLPAYKVNRALSFHGIYEWDRKILPEKVEKLRDRLEGLELLILILGGISTLGLLLYSILLFDIKGYGILLGMLGCLFFLYIVSRLGVIMGIFIKKMREPETV